MKELRFDHENHTYTLWGDGYQGLVIPSITQVIQRADLYGYARTASNVVKMNHGTRVHKNCELYDKLLIDPSDVSDETPEIISYSRFAKELKFSATLIEHKLFHPAYLYAGTIDRLGTIQIMDQEINALIELKTGTYHPAVELQLAAQHSLLIQNGYKVDKCFALYLHPDGNYTLKQMQGGQRSLEVFISALTILRWKELHRIGR